MTLKEIRKIALEYADNNLQIAEAFIKGVMFVQQDENVLNEVWKPVKLHKGLYEVSTFGRVRSVERNVKLSRIGTIVNRHLNPCLLKPNIMKIGYVSVQLSKNGKAKLHLVHRLVAEAFIPNPHEYKYVNHKDEDKTNNNVSNLEWCSQEHNSNWGTALIKSMSKNRNRKDLSIKVAMIDKVGKVIRKFESMNDASRIMHIHSAIVSAICSGKRKAPDKNGYYWRIEYDRRDKESHTTSRS